MPEEPDTFTKDELDALRMSVKNMLRNGATEVCGVDLERLGEKLRALWRIKVFQEDKPPNSPMP